MGVVDVVILGLDNVFSDGSLDIVIFFLLVFTDLDDVS